MRDALPTHYFTLFCFPQATHSQKYICHDSIQLTALAKPTRYLACMTNTKQCKSDPAISHVTSSPAGWAKAGPATGALRAGDFTVTTFEIQETGAQQTSSSSVPFSLKKSAPKIQIRM